MKLGLNINAILLALLLSLLPLAASAETPSTTTTTTTSSINLLNPPKAPVVYEKGQKLYDQYPWAAMYYYGITGHDALGSILIGDFHRWPEHIQSIELSRTLSEQNFLRRLVSPLVGIVQVVGNITMRNGSNENTIYEFDPYIAFRWANLPWNNYVNTSFAIGEGISYTSSVPAIERNYSDNTKRLLNYLMLEATVAHPAYPRLQAVVRLHHRSGAFGLYHADNSGSNDIGLGIRYLFD